MRCARSASRRWASGRVAGWGDLLLTPRGADRHRELATSLQHGPPACLSGLPATGPGGVRASLRRMAGCATPTGSAGHAPGGAQTDHELTFKPDHPRGADQSRPRISAKASHRNGMSERITTVETD